MNLESIMTRKEQGQDIILAAETKRSGTLLGQKQYKSKTNWTKQMDYEYNFFTW